MKLTIEEKGENITREILELSPSEWLIIRIAMRNYCDDKNCPEADRKLIEQMFNDVFEPTFVSEKDLEDYVSRQAAINVAVDAVDDWDGGCNKTREEYIRKALETIPPVTLAEKPNKSEILTGWIPVSEKLPEKNMTCLVAVGKFNLTQMAMYSDLMGTIDHRIFYQGDYGNDSFEDITQYVNAWMYFNIPKPYKASQTEAKSEE